MWSRMAFPAQSALRMASGATTMAVAGVGVSNTPMPRVMASGSSKPPKEWKVVLCEAAQYQMAIAVDFADKYDLLDELGHGSYGVVHRVRHKLTGQLRAVKQSLGRACSADDAISFSTTKSNISASELDAIATLDHPNIVGFVEYFTIKENLFIVQELCEGITLEKLLEQRKGSRFGSEEAVALLLKQMLEAVRHCHESGFVHRDLKLDNFLFTSPDGQMSDLKLIDFGLACRCEPGEWLQGSGGTVLYSPPEALDGHARFGPPGDMWALGAIFYVLLTGEPLIKTECSTAGLPVELRRALEQDATRKILDANYVRLRIQSVSTRVSAVTADLLHEMLRHDPSTRITSAQALKHPFFASNATNGSNV